MLWKMGTAIFKKLTRITHQKESMEIIGITALPAPRRTAARLWLAASRKKNSEQIRDLPTPKAMASGSEVHLALEAAKARPDRNVRVVSFPSWELFAEQPQDYRDDVLPPACTRRLAVEAGSTMGWERWTGAGGRVLGLDRFGESAPAKVLAEKFGFTAARVLEELDALLG